MTLFGELEVIDDAQPRSAAMQMAIDEALLQCCSHPVLRFYTWGAPAISIGYFSRFAEVQQFEGERELVRRWTGGGVVPHGDDLTYCLAIPRDQALCRSRAALIYTPVHQALQQALRTIGIETTMTATAAPRLSDACFANPVAADLLLDNQKIAGAAQRRSRAGLLHQGSVQIPDLPHSVRRHFAAALASARAAGNLSQQVIATADRLARARYQRPEWLRMR